MHRTVLAVAAGVLLTVAAADSSAASTCSSPAFGSPRHLALPGVNGPNGLAAADFDGDGHLDLATVYETFDREQELYILLGDGAAGFALTTIPLPAEPRLLGLDTADVTGDGVGDLIATGFDAQFDAYLVVLAGDGTGGFSPPSTVVFGTGVVAQDFDLADLDDDGDLDIVAVTVTEAHPFAGGAVVLENNGGGAFTTASEMPLGTNPTGVRLADFDSDGNEDLAVALFGLGEEPLPGSVELRLGDGLGGFGAAVSSHVVPNPYRLEAADLDDDGDLDLVVPTAPPNGPGTLTVMLGNGAGDLGAPVALETLPGLYVVAIADLTGDGHVDAVGSGTFYDPVRQVSISALAVFPGDGRGSFGADTLLYPQGDGSGFLPAVGDFDEDGQIDIVAAGRGPGGGGRLALFFNMCGNIADLAISASDTPDPVLIGRQVTYTVVVVNHGPDAAPAALGFRLPPGMTFVSASPSSGFCAPPQPTDPVVRCTLGDLTAAAPGNSSTVTVVLTAESAGTVQAAAAVVTPVQDPLPGNNTWTDTTHVAVIGGVTPTISVTAAGATSLTWAAGDVEAGYVIWRTAGGVVTRFPASGKFPAGTTAFVDPSPVAENLNCYRVVPSRADDTPLARSRWLCQLPGTASPPGTLADFRLRHLDDDQVQMDWSPFGGGEAGYLITMRTAAGPGNPRRLPADELSVQITISESTCFALVPVDAFLRPLANSAVLCAERAP